MGRRALGQGLDSWVLYTPSRRTCQAGGHSLPLPSSSSLWWPLSAPPSSAGEGLPASGPAASGVGRSAELGAVECQKPGKEAGGRAGDKMWRVEEPAEEGPALWVGVPLGGQGEQRPKDPQVENLLTVPRSCQTGVAASGGRGLPLSWNPT